MECVKQIIPMIDMNAFISNFFFHLRSIMLTLSVKNSYRTFQYEKADVFIYIRTIDNLKKFKSLLVKPNSSVHSRSSEKLLNPLSYFVIRNILYPIIGTNLS